MGVTSGVTTPGTRDEATQASNPVQPGGDELCPEFLKNLPNEDDNSPELTGEEATNFRGLSARANYLALDRADIQFAVKEVARRMVQAADG